MLQRRQSTTRGLIAINGMKPYHEWMRMLSGEKMDWLAQLTPIERLGQASVNAMATKRTVEEVILAWTIVGLISHTEALEALSAEPDATRGGQSRL